jgi:hypothetical protein
VLKITIVLLISFMTFNNLHTKAPCENIYKKIIKFRPFKNYRWDPFTMAVAFKSEEPLVYPKIYKMNKRLNAQSLRWEIQDNPNRYVIKKNLDGSCSIGVYEYTNFINLVGRESGIDFIMHSHSGKRYALNVYKFKKKDLYKIGYELEHLGGNSYIARKINKRGWDPLMLRRAFDNNYGKDISQPEVYFTNNKIDFKNRHRILKNYKHIIIKNPNGEYLVAKLDKTYDNTPIIPLNSKKVIRHKLLVYVVSSETVFHNLGYDLTPLGDGHSFIAKYVGLDIY